MLSKKDIIALNLEFDKGIVVNEGSLDYAIDMTHRSKNWLKAAALLTRAILVDHVFEDGNKRTAAALIITCFELFGVHYNAGRVNLAVVRIIRENITDVRKIERLIKDAV